MTPPPRVLLVDDNTELVDNLREILGGAGYAVLTASTAKAALEAARAGYEVALVDLRLPDDSGTALAARLRAAAPEGEVVLLTGYATLETAIAAVRAGAFAYLVKPCATNELLLTIEQALRQVRLQAEKRALSRRAQVAEKLAAVGTMTAGLSHEIRNPLNAAGLQLAVLERRLLKLSEPERGAFLEPLHLVRDEIRRLERLLADFLEFARPRELVASPVDLVGLVRAALGLLAGEAERRSITLSSELEEGLAPVAGDPGRLHQVLMNLVLNAFEAVERGGRVQVTLSGAGRDLLLAVDDSGPGVAPELRERLFEPFFTTKAQGSGLGLPIVHAIVLQHGGNITIDRSLLGGARFTVSLPQMERTG